MPGRLTLIARMGAEHVFELLPPLLRAVRETEQPVVWACDPMHANVFKTESGVKTRRFDAIMAEIEGFFAACRAGAGLARRRPPRVHGRGRHRVPGRLRGRARGAADRPLHDALRPAAERAPVARPRLPPRRAHARARARSSEWPPERLAIVGTGLIGASVGLAAKRAGVAHVAGYDADPESPRRRGRARRGRRAGGLLVAAVEERRPRRRGDAGGHAAASGSATRCSRAGYGADRHGRRLDEERPLRRRSPTASASSAAIPSAARRRVGPRARERASSSRARPGSSRRSPRRSRSATGCCTASSPRSAPSRSRSTRQRTTACSR